jgi:hypothetical protein
MAVSPPARELIVVANVPLQSVYIDTAMDSREVSMRRYRTSALWLLIAVVILGHAAPAAVITGEEFRLRSGAEVEL